MTLSMQLANYTHLLVHKLTLTLRVACSGCSLPGDLCCFFGQFDVLLVYAGPNMRLVGLLPVGTTLQILAQDQIAHAARGRDRRHYRTLWIAKTFWSVDARRL